MQYVSLRTEQGQVHTSSFRLRYVRREIGWAAVRIHERISETKLIDRVGFKIRGSHFFTENGSEIGRFKGNLAVRSNGTGFDSGDDDGMPIPAKYAYKHPLNIGHGGHGFWLQGGGVDVTARLLAKALSDKTGGSFVVVNKVGASGFLGASAVAHSAPDGYNLLIASDTMTSAPGCTNAWPTNSMISFEPLPRMSCRGSRSILPASLFLRWNALPSG